MISAVHTHYGRNIKKNVPLNVLGRQAQTLASCRSVIPTSGARAGTECVMVAFFLLIGVFTTRVCQCHV